ncbi:MAG: PaaX family transcriptional regulator C-terminal domain-containing protein [Antricoccus sp.]
MVTAQERPGLVAAQGARSARSLLLTVLGEFIYPRDGRAWTGTLISALGALGVEEKAARQAISRAGGEGLLVAVRHGRRVQWELTGTGAQILREGTDRIYSFMTAHHPWDGQWLILNVAVPETQRKLRHQLRTRLSWLGLGSLAPGLWIVPDISKEVAVRDILESLQLADRAFAWRGKSIPLGTTQTLSSNIWDLENVEKEYLTFIEQFENLNASSPSRAFIGQVELIEQWRRFPFLDPDLPTELLQHDWPGPRAAACFHKKRTQWHRQAQAYWDHLDLSTAAKS